VGLLSSYRTLAGNAPLVRLLGGEFVSAIGDWLYFVALLVLVYQDSGSPLLLGLVGAARQVPFILLSIPAGIVADRYDRRLVLLSADLARCSLMVVLTLVSVAGGPLWSIVGLAIVASCCATLFGPAIGALLPTLVRDESEFGPANSAFATLDNLAYGVGPAIGGLLILFGGISLAFLLNAVAFAIGAAVVWRLPHGAVGGIPTGAGETATDVDGVAVPVAVPAAVPAAVRDDRPAIASLEAPAPCAPGAASGATGASVAASSTAAGGSDPPEGEGPPESGPSLRAVVTSLSGLFVFSLVTYFFTGGLEIITVLIAVNMLQAGEGVTGFLNAAIGLGGVVGALVSGALIVRRRLEAPLFLGALTMGLGLMATGAASALWFALVALTVMEAGNMILDVAEATLLQRAVPNAFRGRAFGLMDSVRKLALVAGALILPALADDVYVRQVLIISGILTIVACFGLVALFDIGRLGTPPVVAAAAARVQSLPIFAGLPAPRVEAALARMREVRVGAGQVVVRQGDRADRFYVISSGRFRVSHSAGAGQPELRLRELGPGDVFGEIGLLRGVPRTATVTADTDGVLASLGAADFLALVASGPGERSRFLNLYGGGGAVLS
jgi:MFS family permease